MGPCLDSMAAVCSSPTRATSCALSSARLYSMVTAQGDGASISKLDLQVGRLVLKVVASQQLVPCCNRQQRTRERPDRRLLVQQLHILLGVTQRLQEQNVLQCITEGEPEADQEGSIHTC